MFNVVTTPLKKGFSVGIGCQRFFVLTLEALLSELKAYLENPEETEEAAGARNSRDLPLRPHYTHVGGECPPNNVGGIV